MATKTNRLWAIAALVVIGTGFSACLKSVDTTPQRPKAAFSVINGIVSSVSADFYDNDTKITGVIMPMGFSGRNYPAYGGSHKFDFVKTTTSTVWATSTLTYDSLTYYTLVTYGDTTGAYVKSIKDDFTGYSTSNVNIRFFNLSPNSTVDLYAGDIKIDSNLAYVGNTSASLLFKPLANTSYVSTLKVKATGTGITLAELNNTSLQGGYVYTVYLTGLSGTTGPLKPAIGVVQSLY
jgi:hypothetical protein